MSFLELPAAAWQRARQWASGHKKVLLGTLGVLLAAIVTFQLAYPAEKALFGARLNGEPVAGQMQDELVQQVSAGFDKAQIVVQAGEKSEAMSLEYAGAVLEADRTVQALTDYPLWQRLVPFSLLMKRPHADHLEVTFSQERLEEVAGELSEALSIPAEDAKLAVSEGELVTTPAKTGQKVAVEAVQQAVKESDFIFGTTTLAIDSEAAVPTVGDDDIALMRAQAEGIIQRQLVIVSPSGEEFIPSKADITSWLTVVQSEEGRPELAVDQEPLAGYIGRLNEEVGIKPGTARATVVDGEEVARTEAPPGLAIASDELMNDITEALFTGSAVPARLTIRLVGVAPVVIHDRSYSPSQKGLQAYVDHVTGSEDVRIAVSQTRKNGWSAHGRADEQVVAASTYKLYVAYMLFDQIRQGKLDWSSGVQGTDAAGCLERMIVHSDNPCPEELLEKFGGRATDSFLHSKGISKVTTFISSVAAQTTAGDLEKMLRGIEDGSMIGGSDRDRLLDAMGRQRFRAGVPAGSGGVVQNKVGFLWDYLHDAAIVRHPKGDYVIAIMTKGSSWNRIAEVTREIEQIMYSG